MVSEYVKRQFRILILQIGATVTGSSSSSSVIYGDFCGVGNFVGGDTKKDFEKVLRFPIGFLGVFVVFLRKN